METGQSLRVDSRRCDSDFENLGGKRLMYVCVGGVRSI